jgi:hypothetical protein
MAVTSVISDELTALASSGRFATVLCRLSRARVTGVVYLEREDGGAVVSLRDGVPVFIEDLGGADPLGDALLAQEVITPEQFTKIMEHTLSDLTGSEDIAFADKAVELGVLTQAQVDAELQRRVRGQLIQALAWDSARIEIDDDPDGLTGREYPQAIGPLLYMAVRTFFDEDRIAQLLGDHRDIFLRLLRARAEVADDLGLDDSERELLEAFDPPSSVRGAIDRLAADSLEAHQLAAMLVLAEHAEHANRPWSAPIEVPSQQRAARNPAPMGRYVATEALPEERLGPIVRTRPVGARPATPERPQPRVSTSDDDYAFVAPPEAAAAARPPSTPQRPPSTPQRPPSAPQRAPSAPVRPPSAPQRAPSAPQPRMPQSSPTPASRAQQPEPSAAPVHRPEARPRRLGAALKRLGKELEDRRAHTQQVFPEHEATTAAAPRPAPAANAPVARAAPSPGAPAAAPSTAAEPNAVRELIRRRRAMVSQQARSTGTEKKPPAVSAADLMRSAQDALRDQQFARAQELLARACEAEPSNDIYKMFRLWAAFRANTAQEAEQTELKTLVRAKLNDDVHKGFAYYAMGHISLVEKKDDAAEKFFRKAMELDKHNKDAERHVRLLELRKKSAASDSANNKIFGIEIGNKKS